MYLSTKCSTSGEEPSVGLQKDRESTLRVLPYNFSYWSRDCWPKDQADPLLLLLLLLAAAVPSWLACRLPSTTAPEQLSRISSFCVPDLMRIRLCEYQYLQVLFEGFSRKNAINRKQIKANATGRTESKLCPIMTNLADLVDQSCCLQGQNAHDKPRSVRWLEPPAASNLPWTKEIAFEDGAVRTPLEAMKCSNIVGGYLGVVSKSVSMCE